MAVQEDHRRLPMTRLGETLRHQPSRDEPLSKAACVYDMGGFFIGEIVHDLLHSSCMKYIRLLLILAIISIVGIIIYQAGQSSVDTTGKYHTSIYAGAEDVFDGAMIPSLFREQEIDGEIIGSSTAFRVEWQKPERDYNHFVLTISNTATGWSRAEAGEHERVALDVTGLEVSTQYTVVLQACLDSGCEHWYVSEMELDASTGEEVYGIDEESGEEVVLNP
jgi:hypothetical protein